MVRELRPQWPGHGGLVSPVIQEYAQLLPIKVDTRRGLLGLRLLPSKGSRQAEFDRVRTLADLPASAWARGELARCAGCSRRWASGGCAQRITTMFRMLMADRFDAFPRGVNENL